MRTAAVIVAGGRSSRMGREKAFAQVGGQIILGRIIATLRQQGADVLINANGNLERFSAFGLQVIEDIRHHPATPLAGLHAALRFAARESYEAVATVPSDCPFLPKDLISRLAAQKRLAAIAASDGQLHYLTGLWRPGLLPQLEQAMDQSPRLQDWVRQCGAATVEWAAVPFDPFFNVNTPEELAEADRIAAEFQA